MSARPLLAALALTAAACGGEPARYRVVEGAIVDPEGATIVLRGLNVSSRHKLPPYFDFHERPDYDRAATWGMNSIRFLVTWSAIEPSPGVYDEAYLDAVRAHITTAGEAGLRVIVDMHQDVFGLGFAGGDGAPRWACDEARYAAFSPTSPWFLNYLDPNVTACFDRLWTDASLRASFAGAWRALAARLVDLPYVIGFDVLNEPHWGSYDLYAFERDRLQPFYEQVIKEVRGVAPDWLAFVEPASSRNVGIPTSLGRLAVDRVVYAPHSYDAEAEQGLGFDAAKREKLIANVGALAEEADRIGAALWIGEYGGIAAHANIGDYMDAQFDAISAVAGSSAYWHYGKDDGYGVLDANGDEKPSLMPALVRPYPDRVVGKLRSYRWDEQTSRLTIVTEGASRIEVRWPTRLPAPTAPPCGGCTVEQPPGRLLLSGRPLPAEITLGP